MYQMILFNKYPLPQVFVDNGVKSPQYLESEMLRAQNVGMHL